jgi:hypothetical protein
MRQEFYGENKQQHLPSLILYTCVNVKCLRYNDAQKETKDHGTSGTG